MVRMSAEERRAKVVQEAVHAFAYGGYDGTSTEEIARRVGVSQPYLFRLFPNKQAIFRAAVRDCMMSTRDAMTAAAEGLPAEERMAAMAAAYSALIEQHPERLLLQMQTYAATAAATASGDHAFGEVVREQWQELWDAVHEQLGGDIEETTDFLAHGMLINTLVSLGFPPEHRNWRGFDEGKPDKTLPRGLGAGGRKPGVSGESAPSAGMKESAGAKESAASEERDGSDPA
jgi:AcrR family transcriptional regulator